MISVVIPLYNKERHVARAVRSVLKQTYPDFELIVVNDGSTDGSVEVVKTINDPRIRLLRRDHISSWGGHAARNLGIAESRADLIAFLDADDEWWPGHLDIIKRLAERHPECGAYASGYRIVRRDGRIVTPRHHGIPEPPWEGVIPNYFRSRMGSYMVCTSAIAIRKDVFARVGGFPDGERRAGDDDMWIRIALVYDIAFSHHMGLTYHCDADNRISDDRALPFKLRLFDTLATAAKSGVLRPGVSRDDVAELRNVWILGRASRYLLEGRMSAADAASWLQETASTKLCEREWKRLSAMTRAPALLPVWRLRARLGAMLRRPDAGRARPRPDGI